MRSSRRAKPRGSWCAHLLILTAYYLVRRSRCSAPETRLGRQDRDGRGRGGAAKQWRALLSFPDAGRSKNGAKIASSHSSPRPAQREKIAQCARPYASGHTHASFPSPMPCHARPGHALPENEDPLCQAPKTTWRRVAHPPNRSSLVLGCVQHNSRWKWRCHGD